MTQELIWGKSGSPHIDGNDIGTINLAMRGIGNYVLDYKDKLKATVASANKITIGTGVMSFEGRDIIISAAETVTIESGSQGMKRNDIICEHYHRDTSSGVETTNLVAIKGTPASSNPKDPTIPSGTILGGATDAYMPLYRIPLDGISVGTPVQLFEILTPLKTVGDSVTPTRYTFSNPERSQVIGIVPDRDRIMRISGMAVLGSGTLCPIPFLHPQYPARSVSVSITTSGDINILYGDEVTLASGYLDVYTDAS